MRTKQKKYKFSKGQINPKLLERQDLAVLESSARAITNYISTPYGSLKTRGGTENIDNVAGAVTPFPPTTSTPNGSGAADPLNMYNDTAMYVKATIGSPFGLQFAYTGLKAIEKVIIRNVYYSFSAPTLTPVFSGDSVASVTVNDGGVSLNSLTLTMSGFTGTGAILSPVINSSGTITSVTVTSGGSGYASTDTIVSTYVEPSNNFSLYFTAGGGSAVTYKTDILVDKTPRDYEITVGGSYDAMNLGETVQSDLETEFNMFYIRAYAAPTVAEVKLTDFVFSLDEKYVIVLEDEAISIYEDDVLLDAITATGLLEGLFDTLKIDQAENLMIFAHPDLATKQLKRISDQTGTFTAAVVDDLITVTGPTPTNGHKVQLTTTGTLPAGLSLATDYYMVQSTGATCKLLTSGGSEVDITGTGSGTHTLTYQDFYWEFSSFPWTNVPKLLFDGETITNPAHDITTSALEGNVKITSTGTPFTSAAVDVGQYVDFNGGRAKITGFLDTSNVWATTIIPFYDVATVVASGGWDYISGYEDIWSATRGYPNTCLFYQQRLWFLGSKGKPNTIAASRIGQYTDFDNIANYDNDAIIRTISSTQIDEIVNAYVNRGIQVFTAGAEWTVPEGATTPSTFQIVKNTSNGSLATVNPVDIQGTTLFIEKNGKSLLGFVYTDKETAFITNSLSLLTDLIQSPVGIAVDYNSSADVGNFLYMPMADGTMAVWCIDLGQQIQSPVKFQTADGGLIQDVVDVAGDTYILVNRRDIIFLEKLTTDKTDLKTTATMTAGTITGLGDYTGSYVKVYDSTTDHGEYFVMNGQVTGVTDSPTGTVNIGLAFDYSMTSNKIAINGQTENIEKRIAKATVTTSGTTSLTFCGQTITQTDNVYDVYSCTGFAKDSFFTMSGSFDYAEVLSILLNINYGEK